MRLLHLLVFAGLLGSSLAAAEPATLLRDGSLLDNPQSDATVLASLKAKEVVDIETRQGAWARIKTSNGAQGWVRLLNLRTGSGQKSGGTLNTLANVFKTGSSGNTVSTGVKGLSAEKIRNAEPNDAERQRMDKTKSSDNDARQFAKQGKLSSQNIQYLPE